MKKCICAFFALAALLSSCKLFSSNTKQVMLVTDQQGIKDHSYSQLAEDALKEASSKYDLSVKTIVPTSSSGYMDAIAQAAKSHPAYTLISTPKLENAATLTAQAYPEEYFVLIDAPGDLNLDGQQDSPNIYSALFAHEELGYIAGYTAALMSNGNIAFVGNDEYVSFIEYESGFIAGAKAADPSKKPIIKYFPKDMAEADVKAGINGLASNNVDIAFSVAETKPVYTALDIANIKLITLSTLPSQPSKVVMTVNKDIKKAVDTIASEYHSGLFKGQLRIFNVKDGGVSYSIIDERFFSVGQQAQIQAVYRGLSTIAIPKSR